MTRNERELLQIFRLLDEREQLKIIGIAEARAEKNALQKQYSDKAKNASAEDKIKRPFG